MNDNDDLKDFIKILSFIGFLIILGIVLSVALFYSFSFFSYKYSVWSAGQEGKSELARADWNRQITVREAEAKKEASKSLADAEIIRAEGVAKANKIIGDSLKDNQEYLRYLWVNNLSETKNKVIYVPTEAGLPILEAGKR